MRTLGEFRKMVAWFKLHNSLGGFNEDFCNRVDKGYIALLAAITMQFRVSVKEVGKLEGSRELTGQAGEHFDRFKSLIDGAKEARKRL